MGVLDDILGGGDAPEFRPFSTTSDVGDVRVKGDVVDIRLDPRYREIVSALTGSLPGALRPSLSPEQLALGEAATARGAGFLDELGVTDPFDIAERQFARMEEILEPGRARRREDLEARLLRQGRLGSTGGGISEEALETAIEQERRTGLLESLDLGHRIQRQQAELGTQLGGFGSDIENLQLQRLLQSLGSATALEALPAELANVATTLTGQRSQHEIAAREFESGGFGDLLGGALSAGLAAYTGGLGRRLAR